jgi:hypothetical protein
MHTSGTFASRDYGAALLRASLGTMWITHALLKWLVFTLAGAAQYFASVGYPAFLAYPVVGAELLGGVALILGIYARPGLAPAGADPGRRHVGARAEQLGLHQPGWRLGVPGVPDPRFGRALVDRRWCVRPAPQRPARAG